MCALERDCLVTQNVWNDLARIFEQPETKKFLIDYILMNVCNTIAMARQVASQSPHYKPQLPHNVFEWDMLNFQQRLDPKTITVDFLGMETFRSIFITKLLTDLENFQRYLKMIMQRQLIEVSFQLNGCKRVLSMNEDLKLQYSLNRNMVRALGFERERKTAAMEAEKQAKEQKVSDTIQRFVDVAVVIDPTTQRYIRSAHLVDADFRELRDQRAEYRLKQQIAIYKKKINDSNAVRDITISHHHAKIMEFTGHISHWSYEYNKVYEEQSDHLGYQQLRLEAMSNQWEIYKARIVKYREEINAVREMDQMQKQRPKAPKIPGRKKLLGNRAKIAKTAK